VLLKSNSPWANAPPQYSCWLLLHMSHFIACPLMQASLFSSLPANCLRGPLRVRAHSCGVTDAGPLHGQGYETVTQASGSKTEGPWRRFLMFMTCEEEISTGRRSPINGERRHRDVLARMAEGSRHASLN